LHITEGNDQPEVIHLNKLTFKHKADVPMCMPMNATMK
jgi:hypothetical protein